MGCEFSELWAVFFPPYCSHLYPLRRLKIIHLGFFEKVCLKTLSCNPHLKRELGVPNWAGLPDAYSKRHSSAGWHGHRIQVKLRMCPSDGSLVWASLAPYWLLPFVSVEQKKTLCQRSIICEKKKDVILLVLLFHTRKRYGLSFKT